MQQSGSRARLQIRHESGAAGSRFEVQRVDNRGAKAAAAVELPDPMTAVLGSTTLTLGAELAWYLEHYLDYPFGANEQRRDRVLQALADWGRRAFELLFGQGQARDYYRDATRDEGHGKLQLVVASDDARVLSWPWEALHDPAVGDLAQHCSIERQLDQLGDPLPLHEGLSRDPARHRPPAARRHRLPQHLAAPGRAHPPRRAARAGQAAAPAYFRGPAQRAAGP